MTETSHAQARTASADRRPRQLEHRIEMLAHSLVSATSAETALISCRVSGIETTATGPSDNSRWQSLTAKAIAALNAAALNEPAPQDSIEPARIALTPEQLARIAAEASKLDACSQILAWLPWIARQALAPF
jgi:hypothetical protein